MIATWSVYDNHVISAGSVTWYVCDQPPDQCMMSQVISAGLITWSVHDQSRDQYMCNWILWIYLTRLLNLSLLVFCFFLGFSVKIIFPQFPENYIFIHSENIYYMANRILATVPGNYIKNNNILRGHSDWTGRLNANNSVLSAIDYLLR